MDLLTWLRRIPSNFILKLAKSIRIVGVKEYFVCMGTPLTPPLRAAFSCTTNALCNTPCATPLLLRKAFPQETMEPQLIGSSLLHPPFKATNTALKWLVNKVCSYLPPSRPVAMLPALENGKDSPFPCPSRHDSKALLLHLSGG